MKILHLEL